MDLTRRGFLQTAVAIPTLVALPLPVVEAATWIETPKHIVRSIPVNSKSNVCWFAKRIVGSMASRSSSMPSDGTANQWSRHRGARRNERQDEPRYLDGRRRSIL